MRYGYNSIEVTQALYKDTRPVTIAIAHIISVGQAESSPEGPAFIGTVGGGQYKVRESYKEVLEKVRRA